MCFSYMEQPCADDDLLISDPKAGLSVGMIVQTVLVLSRPESKNGDGTLACGCWLDVAVVVVGR